MHKKKSVHTPSGIRESEEQIEGCYLVVDERLHVCDGFYHAQTEGLRGWFGSALKREP